MHMVLKYLLDPAIRIELKSRSQLKEIITEQADPPLANEGDVSEKKSHVYDVSRDMSAFQRIKIWRSQTSRQRGGR